MFRLINLTHFGKQVQFLLKFSMFVQTALTEEIHLTETLKLKPECTVKLA
jgi:hypothetical protein